MKLNDTLYVSDLDRTLLKDDQTLSEETTSYLVNAAKKGLNFTYATARSLASSGFVLKGLELQLPVILYNGAQIYCPKKEAYIHSSYMESGVYSKLLKQLIGDGLNPIVHSLDEDDKLRVYFQTVTYESMVKWINSRLKNGDDRFRVTIDFSEIETSKVISLVMTGPYEQLREYEQQLSAEPTISHVLSEDVYCEGHYLLEISHMDANKGFAVEKLRDHLGLENIVSFGDNNNDLPMFKKSTRSLAVCNAKEPVQNAASGVIGHHNEDAVISYIKEVCHENLESR
ncbi:HAD-IIB family hydrolase [Leucothrix arctica]|uniref:Cof-type HAD-IIB family hydrolase n=1 Tax=Leucothrix arctica TaxID=1481894 RepID=A0A317C5P9_9GAMM|nr:HAD-IIB family hydrolase [Leucothrix arctica]PWQ93541.1 hypothetical protein DKT75_18150 [Leucothrix arctica]